MLKTLREASVKTSFKCNFKIFIENNYTAAFNPDEPCLKHVSTGFN